eukprot:gnl/MRDRNA2_/MRDRNA2_77772_c0_seq1.p2 gnl/MRDRNA2_/MRDRNA2_77772_c0~~gnl/MRDRNA2_/MRDRNA2_77772_c0_seq1.p2  ORF type:complete len:103 (+),score=8.88 gnl/MRDRNA2_/MRDRNA2_77772_c0_seq1:638-946(+)
MFLAAPGLGKRLSKKLATLTSTRLKVTSFIAGDVMIRDAPTSNLRPSKCFSTTGSAVILLIPQYFRVKLLVARILQQAKGISRATIVRNTPLVMVAISHATS